jgi:hypothetical protein
LISGLILVQALSIQARVFLEARDLLLSSYHGVFLVCTASDSAFDMTLGSVGRTAQSVFFVVGCIHSLLKTTEHSRSFRPPKVFGKIGEKQDTISSALLFRPEEGTNVQS